MLLRKSSLLNLNSAPQTPTPSATHEVSFHETVVPQTPSPRVLPFRGFVPDPEPVRENENAKFIKEFSKLFTYSDCPIAVSGDGIAEEVCECIGAMEYPEMPEVRVPGFESEFQSVKQVYAQTVNESLRDANKYIASLENVLSSIEAFSSSMESKYQGLMNKASKIKYEIDVERDTITSTQVSLAQSMRINTMKSNKLSADIEHIKRQIEAISKELDTHDLDIPEEQFDLSSLISDIDTTTISIRDLDIDRYVSDLDIVCDSIYKELIS